MQLRTWVLLIVIPLAVVLGCVLLIWGPTIAYWHLTPLEKVKVLVPKGYEGPVLIAWQIPDGEVAEKERDVWIYRLGADGALLLKNDAPRRGMDVSFWYITDGDKLEPISLNSCFEDSVSTGVVACTGGTAVIYNTHRLHDNQRFHITSTPRRTAWDTSENYRTLLDRYLARLAVEPD